MACLKLKICGIHTRTDLSELVELKPDYLGFIFYPASKRFIKPVEAEKVIKQLPDTIHPVGVFVNATYQEILTTAKQCNLSYIQLHGEESPYLCGKLKSDGLGIIKAFRINTHLPMNMVKKYTSCSDFFLFDRAGTYPGGNGIPFNWNLLASYPFNVPYFLAGGINLQNMTKITQYHLPFMHALDVNSGFEIRPGQKDITALTQLTRFLRHINTEIKNE